MKINSQAGNDNSGVNGNNTGYVIAADNQTWGGSPYDDSVTVATKIATNNGFWNGEDPYTHGGQGGVKKVVRIDQGIDNNAIGWRNEIDRDLLESQYIIEIDSRLGSIANPDEDANHPNISFIDDDNIASYYISDSPFVTNIHSNSDRGWPGTSPTTTKPDVLTVAGPQGTSLRFRIKSSLEIMTSTYLFNTIGAALADADRATWGLSTSNTYRYIDTIVKVTGATTGYKLNLPVRFFKKM